MEIQTPHRPIISVKAGWIIAGVALASVIGIGSAFASGGPGRLFSPKPNPAAQKKAKVQAYRQLLCDEGFSKDIYDLSAYNLDSSRILPYALCVGKVPSNTPMVAATAQRMVQGFMDRLKAEIWLRENDPEFPQYAQRLECLSQETNEHVLQEAIEFLGLGKAVQTLEAQRPSDIASSPEKAQEVVRMTEQVSRRQFIVKGASPMKLIIYLRLSRDGREKPILESPTVVDNSPNPGGQNE